VLAALPAALALMFWPPLDSPFLAPKRAALVILATALISLVAAAKFLHQRSYRGAGLWLAATVLYCGAQLVAAIASARRDVAWLSVLFAVAGPMLALSTLALLGGRERRLVRGIAAAGALQSAILVGQWWLGLDLFAFWGETAAAQQRMRLFGTLGNPDFAAVFVAAALPAIVVLAIDAAKVSERWAWRVAAMLSMIAIAGTASRTGLCAALLGGTVSLAAMTAWRDPRSRRRVLLFSVAALAFAGPLVLARNPRGLSVSLAGRVAMWRVAAGDHPLTILGTGPGTFSYVYSTRLGPFMLRHGGQPSVGYERTANNDVVQALVETGAVGMVALLGVFATWGHAARLRSRDLERGSGAGARLALSAALGGVTAIAAAALFDSPLQRAETWALMWLYSALPFCFAPSPPVSSSRVARLIGAIAAVAITAFAGWCVMQPVRASYWAGRGVRLESGNALPEAIAAYRRAIACDDTNATAWLNLTRAYAKSGDYAAAWQTSEGATLRVHEETLWLLRVRLLEAMNQRLRARVEVIDGLRRFPWSHELLAESAGLDSQ
jgi:hypothetical protein